MYKTDRDEEFSRIRDWLLQWKNNLSANQLKSTLYAFMECVDLTDEIRQYAYSPNGTYPDAGYQIFYKALSNVNSALEAVPNVEGKQATISQRSVDCLAWFAAFRLGSYVLLHSNNSG